MTSLPLNASCFSNSTIVSWVPLFMYQSGCQVSNETSGKVLLIAYPTWAVYGAFVTVIVGLIGVLGAIMTGLTDWSNTYGAERRVGLYHAFFHACATILYLISFVLRLLAGLGDGIAPVIFGFLGLVSVIYAAYLGSDGVFT